MRGNLDEARATFKQSGDKGASIEGAFRGVLRKYLPRRLEVGHGEIVDSDSRRSKQTDVVIVNEDHPLTFTGSEPGLFFIEGVCAAGEVKTLLTSTNLEKALHNCKQFKQLEISPGPGTMIHTNTSDQERFYKSPPWFLIAFDSQLTSSTIKTKIAAFREQHKLPYNKSIDAVFILDIGTVINFGDGKGSLQFRTPEGISLEGFIVQQSNSILFDLFSWLSCVMPRMVRFEPILLRYLIPKEQRSS